MQKIVTKILMEGADTSQNQRGGGENVYTWTMGILEYIMKIVRTKQVVWKGYETH